MQLEKKGKLGDMYGEDWAAWSKLNMRKESVGKHEIRRRVKAGDIKWEQYP